MAEYLAPGVYVEEIPCEARAIAGVATSTAAFLGATQSGPVAQPLLVHSFAEFEAQFGGLSSDMPLGYAVQHYFLNGGREALIGRIVPSGATLSNADLSSPGLEAQQRGLWLLERAERFNVLCIPPLTRTTDVGHGTWDAAIGYAQRRRAIAIVDAPVAWAAALDITETSIAARTRRSIIRGWRRPIRWMAIRPRASRPAAQWPEFMLASTPPAASGKRPPARMRLCLARRD